MGLFWNDTYDGGGHAFDPRDGRLVSTVVASRSLLADGRIAREFWLVLPASGDALEGEWESAVDAREAAEAHHASP